ncbi:hypothetical protein ASE73_02590 [Sphingomonas sp. Leaf24]|uniref:hypothetical protein n=1 Tax=unclassified Sphingomonas TaxID=196159 RepID=UPI000700B57A|nr:MULTISPECIES: hypothetical protein [unclassified Sphingomonas]KQM23131.1 hypothetical protein ASE50_02590 [Sphingomonas sp. Leaf5]KQM95989.1 hypothetical protein ASE73_02590 [Sphingomonas sp. Leaf24]
MQMYELLTPLRRGGGEPIPVGTVVPLSWDDGEALMRLGAAIPAEAAEIAPASTDVDREARRQDLLGQLADVSGVDAGLMVVVAPSSEGDYIMKVGPGGVSAIQPFLDVDPLADADEATIRRHHLDALRDLDDLTYLVFSDSAAAELGGLVLLSPDEESGIVTSVTARSVATVGMDVTDQLLVGTGEGFQLEGATDGDGQAVPPVVIVPADDDVLATMTKGQLLAEAARVSATFDTGMTKPELVEAIRAKRIVE